MGAIMPTKAKGIQKRLEESASDETSAYIGRLLLLQHKDNDLV